MTALQYTILCLIALVILFAFAITGSDQFFTVFGLTMGSVSLAGILSIIFSKPHKP